MSQSVKTAFWVLLYAFIAALCLTLFAQIGGLVKYVFSLLAIYIGIRFFRRFETIGLRITFIAVAILLYFVTMVVFEMFKFIQQNPDVLA